MRSAAAPRPGHSALSQPGTLSSSLCRTPASCLSSPSTGDALAGKVIVEISNPFNATADGLADPEGTSVAQEVAKAAPASAQVVKAFNTIFAHLLAQGRNMDALIAGDDAAAKATVSAFIESLGLRPLDTGGLGMAHWLEGAGLLMIGLGRYGVGNYNFTLGVNPG
jgi:8-hydroxy-5-deazaflavin:NADPH oxidoreductase